MTIVNIHEAKTHLSRLIEKVVAGEEVVIARSGKPLVKMTALEQPTTGARRLGFLKGQIVVPDDFDTMFQKEIEEMFYGDPDKLSR